MRGRGIYILHIVLNNNDIIFDKYIWLIGKGWVMKFGEAS